MAEMRAFLHAAPPNVRVIGGTRFDTSAEIAPEWSCFGSFCFVLPRLEVLETGHCTVLACTLAWSAAATQRANGLGRYHTW